MSAEDDLAKASYSGPEISAASLLPLPVVGIPCCIKVLHPHPFHSVGDKYLRAISHGALCLPLLLPALPDFYSSRFPAQDAAPFLDSLLSQFSGLLFTGSVSNLHPEMYNSDQTPLPPHDFDRDHTTLPLILRAIELKIPFLCICRGVQELVVATGGKLHPRVWEVEGHMDHREDKKADIEAQYAYKAHEVDIVPGGKLHSIIGKERIGVNSLHSQGLAAVSSALQVEARATDGLIEAVSVKDHPFAVGVQWHPEWRFWNHEDSQKLFEAFGKAVREYAATRGGKGVIGGVSKS